MPYSAFIEDFYCQICGGAQVISEHIALKPRDARLPSSENILYLLFRQFLQHFEYTVCWKCALNFPLSQPFLFVMESHLTPITSIAPITHPWLPSLVWTSQWWFMVSFLAPCTNQPVPSICPYRVGIHTHTHTVTWIPGLYTNTHIHISLTVISTLFVFDHYSTHHGRNLFHDACGGFVKLCYHKCTVS